MEPTPQTQSEIRDRLGVLPNFFRLAPEEPSIAANLWAFAKVGYLDNPLPALFKERLFVSLSRFCEARYCVSRHVGFLIGLGRPSGDPLAQRETTEQVVALLSRSLPGGDELELYLARLGAAGTPSEGAPEPDSPTEEVVFGCAAHVFLQTEEAPQCHEALARFFGPRIFQHLLVFLTFVRTAHFWTVLHPELEIDDDISEMLAIHDALAECVVAQPDQQLINQTLQTLLAEREALQRERRLRMSLERVNAELRDQQGAAQLLAAIVDSSDDAIISKRLDGVIQTWNAAAERLFGYTAEQAVGRHIAMLVPPELVSEEESIIARIKRGERIEQLETMRLRRDGGRVEVSETISPVKDAEGRVVGASKIARDITERRKTEHALARSARELAEADQRKDRFLATLAHELRNPLSPIRSCIQVLKAGAKAGDEALLATMDRQVNQMVRLIDDLLDVARISRGKIELRKDRVDLQDVFRRAVESVQPSIDEGGYSCALELPEAPILTYADEARLVQVVSNLLTNAVKYSPAEGAIILRAVADEESIQVSVIDEGIGIPADKFDAIFEMFGQIEGAPHETQGLGIGLTMARELVELHGGQVTARSEGPGKGATFTVTLPLASAPAPVQAEPQGRRDDASGTSGVKVLVVDDSRDSANALALLLKLRGCVVRTAFDGREAIRSAQDFLPAAIFLDIGMPGMSGLEVAEHIRSEAWSKNMLLVALSGWGQAGDREMSKQAGCDAHLVKPADLDALDRILTQASSPVPRTQQDSASR